MRTWAHEKALSPNPKTLLTATEAVLVCPVTRLTPSSAVLGRQTDEV
jgi:hypothetical protein